jgi:hypothetical protein
METEFEKRGEKIKSQIPQLSGMEFIYEDSLEDEETTQISGDLIIDDMTFFLMFEIDQNNKLMGYSASADYMGNDDDLLQYIHSPNNLLPIFFLHCEKEVPMEETLIPLFKRKVMSYVLQTKNLAIR